MTILPKVIMYIMISEVGRKTCMSNRKGSIVNSLDLCTSTTGNRLRQQVQMKSAKHKSLIVCRYPDRCTIKEKPGFKETLFGTKYHDNFFFIFYTLPNDLFLKEF